MKPIILNICLLLLLSCSSGKQEENCTPTQAVELLINHPEPKLSKFRIGYYGILKEDKNFVYVGYWRLDKTMDRTMKPLYKTDKEEFYKIYRKTSHITPFMIDSLVQVWYLNTYPEFKRDTIKVSANTNIKLLKNKTTEHYDVLGTGTIEFFYNKMEASKESGVDSIYNHYTIQKFNYKAFIEQGKEIKWLKEI